MPWGVAAAAVIGAVGSYASAQSAEDASKDQQEAEIKARKELEAQKRAYQLEDRKYRQDAVGSWAKYLDPSLVTTGSPSAADVPPAAASDGKDHSAIDDSLNPVYARNATTGPAAPIKLNNPGAFAGLRPVNGQAPQSLWFPRQYPDYDPNKPVG